MVNDRKLIEYLPPFMQEYVEIQNIMEAEQPEIDLMWESSENALSDQFILEATEHGVKRWERMLNIAPKDTDNLDERKFRILTRLNQELPYTITKLEEALTTLCGAGEYSIDLQSGQYHIEVKLALDNQKNYQAVVDLLTKMIPANMTQFVQILYNPHMTFNQMTHAQLAAYKHDQLRKDVFK